MLQKNRSKRRVLVKIHVFSKFRLTVALKNKNSQTTNDSFRRNFILLNRSLIDFQELNKIKTYCRGSSTNEFSRKV